ncbi:tripartite tricarboxylate transporter permease [Actinophytocola gossypii]|uniref:Tripartite tricarboxylate transporter permease n=1 Tax=Actinophytocola gossypii TaxID=2812003 RepID=A0ABT2J2L0_9PSEU|nr:tripartite tricarboxylate transporter permease [Actinophytocola gossypii]MCT2581839.1 tripartite tricarboxylate transporter permease [Actinophytocola gossypii]
MDTFAQLLDGLGAVLQPGNLLFALAGCLMGMVVGILPGFGPPAAMALLLPVTYVVGPVPGIIMIAAILYGGMYGGTITAVLMNVPGEPSSVATTLDGYPMARQGRGGVALVIAAAGSFVGATIGIIGMVLAAPLATAALSLGARDYFAVAVAGLALVVGLAGRSLVKGLACAVIGLVIGLVGLDPVLGTPRFTGGVPELFDGFDMIAVVMGLFGLSEMLVGLEKRVTGGRVAELGRIAPTREDWRRSAGPSLRGSVIGFFVGLLPGSPGTAATFSSYVLEQRLSKRHRKEFGSGAVEGVAGPESANNSLGIATMVPMFTLGIPSSVTMAIMMGAFVVHGLTPGPLLFRDHPDIAWAIIASLLVGNVILLVLNIPLIRVWLLILRIPFPVLFPIVVGLMVLGCYVVTGTAANILVLVGAGVLGYCLRKLDIPLAPIALTMVLGPILESNLSRALLLSDGDVTTLVGSPFSATLLALAVVAVLAPAVLRTVRRARPAAPETTERQKEPR